MVAKQLGLQLWLGGKAEVRPSSTPEAVLVLNHTLTARLWAVPLVITRPVSGMLLHALSCPGVVHQPPSTGIPELVPLKEVPGTPGTGPAPPRGGLNSRAGGPAGA